MEPSCNFPFCTPGAQIDHLGRSKDKADAEERARVARAESDAKEQPRIAFLKQCVGSRHTTESVEASGNRRAKVGVKKSSTTCEKEYAKLNTDA